MIFNYDDVDPKAVENARLFGCIRQSGGECNFFKKRWNAVMGRGSVTTYQCRKFYLHEPGECYAKGDKFGCRYCGHCGSLYGYPSCEFELKHTHITEVEECPL
jgi:hypothetical protein